MLLANRVAVVTGASGGLGRAIALALAAEGAAVTVHYGKSAAAAEEVVSAIRAGGGRAISHQADVSNPEQAEGLIKAAVDAFGRVDILVNNAGINRDNLLLRMKVEDWDAVMATNLRGVFNCTRAVSRPLLKQRGGRIINIGSAAGILGNAGLANYSASKAGLIGFTRAVARELASRNITCNVVSPGAIDAGMLESLTEDQRMALLNQVPLGRLGTPDDVAGAVVFLASDRAEYITGQTLAVDGGMTMA